MPLFDAACAPVLPAPYWFIAFFKVLGFSLHLIPMGIWLVGLPCAIAFWTFGGVNSKRFAQRLFQQTPIFTALGVNFGIVPLLFVQLAYPKAFYTTTILTAAHWSGALVLAFFAYLFSYLCASGARKELRWRTLFYGLLSFVFYACVGLIFSSMLTLFERPYEWESLWMGSAKTLGFLGGFQLGGFGTASGLATYWRDPIVYLRFAGLFGLAFYTVAFWIVFDVFYLYRGRRKLTEEEEYAILADSEDEQTEEGGKKRKRRRLPIQENPERYPFWAVSASCCLAFLGLLVSAPAFGAYLFKELRVETMTSQLPGWDPTVWKASFYSLCAGLTLPFFFLVLGKLRKISGRGLARSLFFCEALLVGSYAVMRQFLQNAYLSPYFRPEECEVAPQRSAMFAFLGALVFAFLTILLILRLLSRVNPAEPRPKKEKRAKPAKKAASKTDAAAKAKKDGKDRTAPANASSGLNISTSPQSQQNKGKKPIPTPSGKSTIRRM